jgi:DnaJ-class molecular chaperone
MKKNIIIQKELYLFMGLLNNCNQDNIQKKFEELKKLFKENKNKLDLDKLYECYNILSNPQSRKLYDNGVITVDLDNIVTEGGNILFENKHIKQYLKNLQTTETKGKDINEYINITLAEAYKGCKKYIQYILKIPCQACMTICESCNGNKFIDKNKFIAPGLTSNTNEKCNDCNYLGYVYHQYTKLKCENCNGKKYIEKNVEEEILLPETNIICNICNGTKKYNNKKKIPINTTIKCNICNGNGSINQQIKITGNLYKTQQIICNECNGKKTIIKSVGVSSIYKNETLNCNNCNEKGFIIIPEKYVIQNKITFIKCSTCLGKGLKLLEKKKCIQCNNKNYIENKKNFYINLHPAVDNGHSIKIKGSGEQIINGINGDLIITINIINNNVYKRINENLKINLLIHFVKTIIGSSYKIILPSGENLIIDTKEFNEIINPMKLYVYKGKGFPIYDIDKKEINGYGNLYIQFDIIYGKIKNNLSIDVLNKLENNFTLIYDEIEDSSSATASAMTKKENLYQEDGNFK